MTSQKNRDTIRRAHRPVGPDRQCAVRGESYPCDAVRLLDDLEAVEAAARTQAQRISDLQGRIAELEDKIRRAVRELTS